MSNRPFSPIAIVLSILLVFSWVIAGVSVVVAKHYADQEKQAVIKTAQWMLKAGEAEGWKNEAEEITAETVTWNRYLLHIVCGEEHSEFTASEFNVVVPSIEGDEWMRPIHDNFQEDMSLANDMLQPRQHVSNYHDAIIALTRRLKEE